MGSGLHTCKGFKRYFSPIFLPLNFCNFTIPPLQTSPRNKCPKVHPDPKESPMKPFPRGQQTIFLLRRSPRRGLFVDASKRSE
jgi:hypothetical protein